MCTKGSELSSRRAEGLGTPPVSKTQMNWAAAQWESTYLTPLRPRVHFPVWQGAWAVVQLAGCLTCGHSTQE